MFCHRVHEGESLVSREREYRLWKSFRVGCAQSSVPSEQEVILFRSCRRPTSLPGRHELVSASHRRRGDADRRSAPSRARGIGACGRVSLSPILAPNLFLLGDNIDSLISAGMRTSHRHGDRTPPRCRRTLFVVSRPCRRTGEPRGAWHGGSDSFRYSWFDFVVPSFLLTPVGFPVSRADSFRGSETAMSGILYSSVSATHLVNHISLYPIIGGRAGSWVPSTPDEYGVLRTVHSKAFPRFHGIRR